MPIQTLNDLFAALFRPAEGGQPVIFQPQRPLREALFALFFPEALTRQYADKSKSNLTWFFTSDARNRSVRRSLAALLGADAPAVIDETHRKCWQVLWPAPGRPAFDGAGLKAALEAVRLPAGLDARLRVTLRGSDGAPGMLDRFYAADEAAALSRMILTLAAGEDAPPAAMARVWQPDAEAKLDFMQRDGSPSGRLRYCRMLELQGRSDEAFRGYEAAARLLDRPAQTVEESGMYCRLGEMCFTGEGCIRDEKAARAWDRLACLDANPESWRQLSRHSGGQAAREALEHAAELGCGPAVRELGEAWFEGSARLACPRSLERARQWFQRGMTLPGAEGARCAYMLGQVWEAQDRRDAAVNAYRLAREGGSAEAAERLARLDWMLAPAPKPAPPAEGPLGYCLTNGEGGCNRRFTRGLEGRWEVTVCGAEGGGPEAALRGLAERVYWGGTPRFPELRVALMSEDRQRNLFQAAALLGELHRLALSLGDRAWELADQVRIYVLADHDAGALLLDTAFAGMAPLYFMARLCDPALDAADELFSAAPLFLPRIGGPAEAPARLKLLGGGDMVPALLRRALALPMPPESGFAIDVYSPEAAALEGRFRMECPGIRGEGAALCAPLPRFHACPPGELPAAALEDMGAGDYWVIAAGDDALNLRLGALLRGEGLRRAPEARQPFIAVHTAQPAARWLGGSLSAGAEGVAAAWCGQYELHPFGALDMYEARRLWEDPLEGRARRAHMLYIGLPDTRDARHAALGSYYRRQLDRDAARLTALALPYRMHLAGLSLPGWRLYGVPEELARLGAEYTRWLREPEHLEAALRDEHARRNRALLALGWSPASLEQVAAYVGRGNPGHILYPARLDPFICPWAALEDGGLPRRLREIVRARFPEKTVPDPRRDEAASVRDTERMLGE